MSSGKDKQKVSPRTDGSRAIFDRYEELHPLERALADVETTGHWTQEVVAANWRMDGRVSIERERELCSVEEFSGIQDGQSWWSGISSYYWRYLCRSVEVESEQMWPATFCPPNRSNALSLAIPPHSELVHVASLNRLILWLMRDGIGLRLKFRRATGKMLFNLAAGKRFDPLSFDSWLRDVVEEVNKSGTASVKKFVLALFECAPPAQLPWWASFAEDLSVLIEEHDATGICRALGMGHMDLGEWLIVWRYPFQAIIENFPTFGIFRPTSVDAGQGYFHFPSPEGYPYGITMPVGNSRQGALREIIHPPLPAKVAELTCTGRILRISESPVKDYDEIVSMRKNHRRNLRQTLATDLAVEWLDRHRELL